MEWKQVKLGEVISISSGQIYKGEFIGKGNNLLLGMGCVSFKDKFLYTGARQYAGDCADKNIAYPEDIVLATRQQSDNLPILAMPAFIPNDLVAEKVIIGSNLYKVNIRDNDFDTRFIYWLMKTPDYVNYIASVKTGTTVKMITKADVENYTFLCPPIEVRKKVSKILWDIDAQIENNNRINRNLEAQAQALFKSWFVDFEPWGGKMPDGWREYELDVLVDNISGYSYKGDELQSSNMAMATIKNFLRGGGFKEDGFKEIVLSKKIKSEQFVKLFDILVAHTDLTQNADVIGNPAIILSTGGYDSLIMSMDLTKVVPKDNRISQGLMYCILNDRRFKEHALGYVNGTTVLHMSKKAVPAYHVFLPSDFDKLKEIGDVLDHFFMQIANNHKASARLAALRDTLLPKLMKGEIEV